MNRLAQISVAATLLAALPLRAQDAEVPRTHTIPGIESPAFSYAEPEEVGLSSEKLNRLGDEITEWVANGDLVGAELLIIKDGRAVFHEAYGWSDREEQRPVERNSIWSIKSMTKPFVATAVLMLAEEGKLSLDHPVSRYIPGFAGDERTTVRHLLAHTSGFEGLGGAINSYDSFREWVEGWGAEEPTRPFGEFSYSDFNYAALGYVIEAVSGVPADAFLEERIIRPTRAGRDPYGLRSRRPVGSPILDMHLHAEAAHSPPVALCPPFEDLPVWDPSETYSWATMLGAYTDPDCEDPVSSPETDGGVMRETIAIMERRNVFGVLSGPPERVAEWMAAAPARFIPGLDFWVDGGISPDSLRSLYESGALAVLGEVLNQYDGITPDDERMEPYWALAEELDIPVGIHIGKGAPGEVYLGSRDYRARLYSALTLEEVLVRHPRLRVYIMHAGYPMLDDLLSLMYAHPQVYVDVGVLAWAEPRAGFYRYLEAIVDTGFGERVMFGSDQRVWPGMIDVSIAAIEEAPFLSAEEKRDILYHNAARFLRSEESARLWMFGNSRTCSCTSRPGRSRSLGIADFLRGI